MSTSAYRGAAQALRQIDTALVTQIVVIVAILGLSVWAHIVIHTHLTEWVTAPLIKTLFTPTIIDRQAALGLLHTWDRVDFLITMAESLALLVLGGYLRRRKHWIWLNYVGAKTLADIASCVGEIALVVCTITVLIG